jgi:hypothetical protein
MATLLFFGPGIGDKRDTYRVKEDVDQVETALNGDARFVSPTDPGDEAPVWFRADAIRYFYAD